MIRLLKGLPSLSMHWLRVVFVIAPALIWQFLIQFRALYKEMDVRSAFVKAGADLMSALRYAEEEDQRFVFESYILNNRYHVFESDLELWFYTLLYCVTIAHRHRWFSDHWLALRVVAMCSANGITIDHRQVRDVLQEGQDLREEFEFIHNDPQNNFPK